MKSAEDIARIHTLFREGWSKRRIAAELGISRNTVDRYLHSQPTHCPRAETNKRQPKPTLSQAGWCIGPYHLSASGELSLGDARIGIAEAQTQILLMFAEQANQLVSRNEIAKQLWPGQKLSANQQRNVTLSVHRLRDVFAVGPLGGNVIRSVYRKGYVFNAPVQPCPSHSPKKPTKVHPSIRAFRHNPFYGEAHDYWASRDPYKLLRQEMLLQKSVQFDPTFTQGYLELCYFQILQCFWGMRAAQDVLPNLQGVLATVDRFSVQPSGWLAIKACPVSTT